MLTGEVGEVGGGGWSRMVRAHQKNVGLHSNQNNPAKYCYRSLYSGYAHHYFTYTSGS